MHHNYCEEQAPDKRWPGYCQCPWRERLTRHLREAAAHGRAYKSGAAAAASAAAAVPLPD